MDELDLNFMQFDSLIIAWRAAVHGVAKSQTRLSDWTLTKRPSLAKDFCKLSLQESHKADTIFIILNFEHKDSNSELVEF